MAKKIKVLDNVSGVEQIINVSSLGANSTISGSDLMILEQSNTLKKVSITDLSAEFGSGGGTGNYHVLKVEFEANADFETTTVLPIGSQIDKLLVDKGLGLTTGTNPLTFLINGSTPIYLATQGTEFTNDSGAEYVTYLGNLGNIIIASGEEGTFKSEWSGAGPGTGAGYGYLFYWTPLP